MKTQQKHLPVALTVAGSDSGGGAGIQADLKTFAAWGVHGTSVITCLTAQNPRQVLGVQASSPRILEQQLTAVMTELPPAAVKTGMLYSATIIRLVARHFVRLTPGKHKPALVVDPVMVATSGARLLQPAAERSLRERLLPLATLITPNLAEAAVLTGQRISSPEAMRRAARRLHAELGVAVLLKGGHLKGWPEAMDVLYDGTTEWLLSAPFVKGVKTHGTGCTYSAAICAGLARGLALPAAVELAKEYVTQAIAQSQAVGRHTVLGHFTHSAFAAGKIAPHSAHSAGCDCCH